MREVDCVKNCLKKRAFLKSKENVLYKDFMALFNYLFFLLLTVGVLFFAFYSALNHNSMFAFSIFLGLGIGLFVFCLLVLISDDVKVVVSRDSYLEKNLSSEDLIDLSMMNIKFMDAPLKEMKTLWKNEIEKIDKVFMDEKNLKIFHKLLLENDGFKMRYFSYFKEMVEQYEEFNKEMSKEVDAVNEYLEKKGMETFSNAKKLDLKIEEE